MILHHSPGKDDLLSNIEQLHISQYLLNSDSNILKYPLFHIKVYSAGSRTVQLIGTFPKKNGIQIFYSCTEAYIPQII